MKFRNSRSEALIQPYHFNKPSMTQQQFGFDTDINNIVRGMTVPLPIRDSLQNTSDEVKVFTPDMYEKALYVKAEAENTFNRLPSHIREFFKNNPKNMIEFLSDSKNDAKAIELGLKVVNSDSKFVNDLANAVKTSQTAENAVTQPQGESSGG